MVHYRSFLSVLLLICSLFAAAASEPIPVKTRKGKHILNIGYHPLSHDELFTAPCRFHSHESGGNGAADTLKIETKRGLSTLKNSSQKDDECREEKYGDRKKSVNVKAPRSGLRLDHAWDIFVGWVDNAKSDSEFLVEIGVGTPAQTFLASIDTGSPVTWIYSKDCCFQSNHSFFMPEQSSTFSIRKLDASGQPVAERGQIDSKDAQQYTIQYGSKNSGSLSMKLAYETVTVFPYADDSLQVKNQTVGLSTNIVGAHIGQGRDLRRNEALLGLSPGNGSIVPGKVMTPIEQLIRNDAIAQPLFTVTFVKAPESLKQGDGGRLIIGGFDDERTVGDITWVNSTSSVFWGFDFDVGAMRYNNKDIWDVKNKRRAIADTGSSSIYLPKAAAKAINEQIYGFLFDKGASRWLIPCKTGLKSYEDSLPAMNRTQLFTIKIADRTFAMPLRDIVLFPLGPVNKVSAGGKEDYCNSAIQNGPEGFAVLGNALLKNHAVTFDYGGPDLKSRRIGIANRRETGIIVDANGVISAIGSLLAPITKLPLLS